MFINERTRSIEMTKTEYRHAHTYGSELYNELQEVRKAYPNFRVIIKERKQRDNMKGLDVNYMKKYIQAHDNDDRTIWAEFCQLRGLDENETEITFARPVSYGELKMWFLNQYPEVEDMNAPVDAILARVRKERAEKKAKAMEAKAALAFVR